MLIYEILFQKNTLIIYVSNDINYIIGNIISYNVFKVLHDMC